MTYTTCGEFNQTGIEGMMRYAGEVVPIFWPLVLFGLFIIIFIGNFIASGKRFTPSFAVAGIITAIAAFLMGLIGDVIPKFAVVVAVVVSILGVVLLLTSKGD